MQIFRHLDDIKNIEACALTIGNFDGIHLGHQEILQKTKEKATQNDLKSAILTFYPHPIKFFKPESAKNFLISSLAQKLTFFKQYSFDYVFILPFNQEFCQIEAEEFIAKILCKKINIKELIIGYDFIFGKNRHGDLKMLQKNASQFDFRVTQTEAMKKEQTVISSSQIRKLIRQGEIKNANRFLGKNFTISGIVTSGRKLASQIGFPTANINTKNHILQPKFGVYKSQTFIPHLNKKFASITNFGTKPTVNSDQKPVFETNIFDFNDNLYGKKIHIELTSYIRKEKKFDSIEDLKQQIEKDIKATKKLN